MVKKTLKAPIEYHAIRIAKADYKRLELRKITTSIPLVHLITQALDALDEKHGAIKVRQKKGK